MRFRNRYALLGVIACLALNWLGDSLDGTLARVRQRQRPRYGFYVDHMVDSFGALALMGGLALSGYMHPWIAIGLLIAFLMLSIQSYLATHALGEFRISFWRFGPTELRILLAVGNLALFWKPVVHLFGGLYPPVRRGRRDWPRGHGIDGGRLHCCRTRSDSIAKKGSRNDAESDECSPCDDSSPSPPSTLTRWCKFNLVGGIGIAVQFLALFLLKSVMHLRLSRRHRDRGRGRGRPQLRLARTLHLGPTESCHRRRRHDEPGPEPRSSHPQPRWRRSLERFVRFNLTNGAVSILGNLTLMKA